MVLCTLTNNNKTIVIPSAFDVKPTTHGEILHHNYTFKSSVDAIQLVIR